MEHLSKRDRPSRIRKSTQYLLDNLPIQITLVVTFLALLLILAIPFLKAQEDTLSDPASDPWEPSVKVTFHGLGSLVRTTTDSNGREVFMIVDRWYNRSFNEEVDGQRAAFTTLVPFILGSEVVSVNGVRQLPNLQYTRLILEETGQAIGVEFKTPPQVLPDGSKDVLVIDFDPIGDVR